MAEERVQRRLAAIIAADVVGYSRLMGADEEGTLERFNALLSELVEPCIAEHRGQVVKTMGDGLLVVFVSVVDAVRCAVSFQEGMGERNKDTPQDRRIEFRIGVNLGDVIVQDDDVIGDGVNIAARLEGLAKPGGVVVSGTVHEHVRSKLDFGFDDLGAQEFKNIAEPIHAFSVVSAKTVTAMSASETQKSPPLPEKPSIAVLPFANMSGDPEQEYFSDGITEDIITALAKNRWLSVTARNSTFAYKGKSPDIRRVAEELGAAYVVEGSVRKSGKRIRITAQLIDAGSGSHIWAERYDRDVGDIFAVQDEITQTIAATIEPELGAIESQRAKRKPTENLDAWDCYHLALSNMYRFDKDGNAEAQRLFCRAIEIDPDFAAAHARLAYCMAVSMVYFEAEPTVELLDEALRIARKASLLDDQDALAHFAVGRIQLLRLEYDHAIAEFQTSVELNPNLAQAHCALGDALAYAGRLNESTSCFEEAVRLSPRDPYRWGFLMFGSLAHLFSRRHKSAAEWAEKSVRVPNSHYWANVALVAALGHLNRLDEARSAVAELLRKRPGFSCSFAKDHLFYVKDSAQIEHYVNGLRKAGVPE
jgi:TolB-like protein/class 3 adenylate cyclase